VTVVTAPRMTEDRFDSLLCGNAHRVEHRITIGRL
jgi:hypothetical protein